MIKTARFSAAITVLLTTLCRAAVGVVNFGCNEFPHLGYRSCYTGHDPRVTAVEAIDGCRQLGYRLSLIPTDEVQEWLQPRLNEFGRRAYWIAAEMLTLSGFEWINGQLYRGQAVANSQSSCDQSFVSVKVIVTENWPVVVYSNNPCWDPIPRHYLCQLEDQNCTGRLSFMGKCYVKSQVPRRWYSARNQCLGQGGDLAILPDDELTALFTTNRQWIESNVDYWIGLRRIKWKWMSIKEPDDVRYTNWATNSPRNEEERCVAVSASTGYWMVYDCDKKLNFLCENVTSLFNESTSVSTTPLTSRSISDKQYSSELPEFTAIHSSTRSSTSGVNVSYLASTSARSTPVITPAAEDVTSAESKLMYLTTLILRSTTDGVPLARTTNIGVIVGVVVCLLLVLVVLACILFVWLLRKKRSRNSQNQTKPLSENGQFDEKNTVNGNDWTTSEQTFPTTLNFHQTADESRPLRS